MLGLVRPPDSRLAATCPVAGVREIVYRVLELDDQGAPAPESMVDALLDLSLCGLLKQP